MRLAMLFLNNPFGLMFLGGLILLGGAFGAYRGFQPVPERPALEQVSGQLVQAALKKEAPGGGIYEFQIQGEHNAVRTFRVSPVFVHAHEAAQLKPGNPVEILWNGQSHSVDRMTSNGRYIVDWEKRRAVEAVQGRAKLRMHGGIAMLAGFGILLLGWRWFRRYAAQHWS